MRRQASRDGKRGNGNKSMNDGHEGLLWRAWQRRLIELRMKRSLSRGARDQRQ